MSKNLRGTGLETAADFKNWTHPMEDMLAPFVALFGRVERPPDRGKMLLACLFLEAELKGTVLALVKGLMQMHPELPYENDDQMLAAATTHMMSELDRGPGATFEAPDMEGLRDVLRRHEQAAGRKVTS